MLYTTILFNLVRIRKKSYIHPAELLLNYYWITFIGYIISIKNNKKIVYKIQNGLKNVNSNLLKRWGDKTEFKKKKNKSTKY